MTTTPARTGRGARETRAVTLETGVSEYAEGSCAVRFGRTHVLCSASVDARLPDWRRESGRGWVTAEYAMLPRATHTRTSRERGRVGGRTQEIQRLIGRSLRAAVDFDALGEHTIIVDCDVLVADGGTRTAAITGGAVALHQACELLVREGRVPANPMRELVAAVSVGVLDSRALLDLEYAEDVAAEVDMNLVALESGRLVEVQGTAEGEPFSREMLDQLIDLGLDGIERLVNAQRETISQ